VANSISSTLTRLAHRRFQSFSDAAEAVVTALADAIPGVVLLGRIEPNEQTCRVIDVCGTGLESFQRGAVLPIITPTLEDVDLDSEFLRTRGAQASLVMPLLSSEGIIVGVLCALDASADVYLYEHAALLGVAALLLSHEWESVQRRAELRRLRARLSEGPGTDSETGFADRDGFLELLEREWRLATRGTVESVLVTCSVNVGGEQNAPDEAVRNVAVKIVAEILGASARVTDHVGRVGQSTLAVILVGCRIDEAPAFVERFQSALGRVTDGRHPPLEISHSLQSLAAVSDPEDALNGNERDAGTPTTHKAPHLAQGTPG
jgi:GGDEF domain-containing protein